MAVERLERTGLDQHPGHGKLRGKNRWLVTQDMPFIYNPRVGAGASSSEPRLVTPSERCTGSVVLKRSARIPHNDPTNAQPCLMTVGGWGLVSWRRWGPASMSASAMMSASRALKNVDLSSLDSRGPENKALSAHLPPVFPPFFSTFHSLNMPSTLLCKS